VTTTKYFHAPSEWSERFTGGPFDTMVEAIADGRREYADQDAFAVFEGELIDPVEYAVLAADVDLLLERIEDEVADDCANDCEVIETRDGYREAFEQAIKTWARAYLTCKWHKGTGDPQAIPVKPGRNEDK